MTISIIVKDLQQRGYSKSQKKNTFGYEYFKKFDDKVCDYLFTKFSNDCKCCLINSMEVPLKNLADFSDYILLMTDKKTED